MPPGPTALQIAADLARQRRDQAVQVLAQANAARQAAAAQFEQLQAYAGECTARWAQQQRHCTPEIMRHHYAFMARLDHAIGLQRRVMEQHAARVEREARAVREAEARLESLKQVDALRAREESLRQSRREQKINDEQAATLHRRRLASMTVPGGLQ